MVQTNVSSWDAVKCAIRARDQAEHCYLPLCQFFPSLKLNAEWNYNDRLGNLPSWSLESCAATSPFACHEVPPRLASPLTKRNSVPLPHKLAQLNTSRQEKQYLGTLIALMLSPPVRRADTWWTKKHATWDLAVRANYCRFRAGLEIWVLNYWHPWNPFHWSYISFHAEIPSQRKKKSEKNTALNSCTNKDRHID